MFGHVIFVVSGMLVAAVHSPDVPGNVLLGDGRRVWVVGPGVCARACLVWPGWRSPGGFFWVWINMGFACRRHRCGFLSARTLLYRVSDEGVDAVPATPGSPVDRE